MEEIKELVYILNKYKVRSIEIIGDDSRQYDSKLYQFYDAVQKGAIHNDAEAALLIYGQQELSGKYRNLKHELKKRLLNTLFFIDTNSSRKRDESYYQCWKEWAACRILIEKSARITAIKLSEKIIRTALKFDFPDLIISISILLRTHYALREKNKSKFEYYDELYESYSEDERYKNLAHKYYMRLILDYAIHSVTPNPKIKEDADRYYFELVPLKQKTESIKFHYYLYQIQLLGAMGIFDYDHAKNICEEAHLYLTNNNIQFKGGIRHFLLNKLVCHIQLREFEEGIKTAIASRKLITEGEFNWFKTNEYIIMLSFHTGNYQEAYHIYNMITHHSRFKHHKILHETWSLYRMYLHFLHIINKVLPQETDHSFNKIRLGRFLNEVPSFSKDKSGMNIPVLIIQMCFLILQKRFDDAIERIEALNKYCGRYLKTTSPNFRSNCFIKMLLYIPASGFNRKNAELRAQRHLDKLKTVKINFNSQAHEVEVLPFEEMWELILDALDGRNSTINFGLR